MVQIWERCKPLQHPPVLLPTKLPPTPAPTPSCPRTIPYWLTCSRTFCFAIWLVCTSLDPVGRLLYIILFLLWNLRAWLSSISCGSKQLKKYSRNEICSKSDRRKFLTITMFLIFQFGVFFLQCLTLIKWLDRYEEASTICHLKIEYSLDHVNINIWLQKRPNGLWKFLIWY